MHSPTRLLAILLALTISAIAQPSASQITSDNDGMVQTPEQLRRAEPPPPDASRTDLEIEGDRLRGQKAYADAIDYYAAAMQRFGADPVLHNKSGIALLHMMRYDEAKKEFERAIKLKKDYAEAHNNLGVIHYMKRKHRAAVKAYEKAIAISPDSASYYSNLGTAWFARKKYEKAAANYIRAIELDPGIFERRSQTGISAQLASPEDRGRYNYMIAKMYARVGDSDRCLLYLRKAMEEEYSKVQDARREPEFEIVRKDPRFLPVMENQPLALAEPPKPIAESPQPPQR